MSSPLISAIICTHNRADYLGLAIDSLLQQTYDPYEVIVVDNASSDATAQVVQDRQPHPRLSYIYEPTLGLSVARNRGGAAARGEILAYLDDDAVATCQWLAALVEVFQRYPAIAIVGGRVELIWPPLTGPPAWLSAGLAANLGVYDLGDQLRLIQTAGETPRGLNYAVRRCFFEQVGGFDRQLGRVGKNLLSNEELQMTQQALNAGLDVAYAPQAIVAHHVGPERLKRQWFLSRSWWQGISECYRERANQSLSGQRLRSRSICILRGLVKALRHWQNPAQRFENLVYAYGQLGYVYTALRQLQSGSTPKPDVGSLV